MLKQADCLAALIPHLDDDLLDKARVALLQCLLDVQNFERRDLFGILAENGAAFLRAFDLPQEAYGSIAKSIIDVCTKWEWL